MKTFKQYDVNEEFEFGGKTYVCKKDKNVMSSYCCEKLCAFKDNEKKCKELLCSSDKRTDGKIVYFEETKISKAVREKIDLIISSLLKKFVPFDEQDMQLIEECYSYSDREKEYFSSEFVKLLFEKIFNRKMQTETEDEWD